MKKTEEIISLLLAALACCLGGISPEEAENKWHLLTRLKAAMGFDDSMKKKSMYRNRIAPSD